MYIYIYVYIYIYKYDTYISTHLQMKDIATIRRYIADLSVETKEGFSVWIDNLGDVDVLRYLLAFGSAENAW